MQADPDPKLPSNGMHFLLMLPPAAQLTSSTCLRHISICRMYGANYTGKLMNDWAELKMEASQSSRLCWPQNRLTADTLCKRIHCARPCSMPGHTRTPTACLGAARVSPNNILGQQHRCLMHSDCVGQADVCTPIGKVVLRG